MIEHPDEDFERLMAEITKDVAAEGPAAVAALRALDPYFLAARDRVDGERLLADPRIRATLDEPFDPANYVSAAPGKDWDPED